MRRRQTYIPKDYLTQRLDQITVIFVWVIFVKSVAKIVFFYVRIVFGGTVQIILHGHGVNAAENVFVKDVPIRIGQ